MSKWRIAESKEILRKPTEKERADQHAYLWNACSMDATKAKIERMKTDVDKMVEGIDKERAMRTYQGLLGTYENNERDINRIIENGMWRETVMTYRDPTSTELKQQKRDKEEHAKFLEERARYRANVIALMRKEAKNSGLTNEEYLMVHPSDVSLEEMND